MKRLFVIIIFSQLTFVSFGQNYLTTDIKVKAESLIKKIITDSVFKKYCTYDTTSNYYYWQKGICIGENLTNTKKTKGQFISAKVSWTVNIHYPFCPILNNIKGSATIELDEKLQLVKTPDLEFIPRTYWTNENCEFISKENAIYLAKQQNLEKGIDSLHTSINYDPKEKQYFWYVSQTLKKTQKFHSGRTKPYVIRTEELVIIDAISEKIISHEIYDLGILP